MHELLTAMSLRWGEWQSCHLIATSSIVDHSQTTQPLKPGSIKQIKTNKKTKHNNNKTERHTQKQNHQKEKEDLPHNCTQLQPQHTQRPECPKSDNTQQQPRFAYKQRPEEAKFIKVLHLTHTTVCNYQHHRQHNHDDKHSPQPRPLIGHFFNRLNYCSLEKDRKVRTWNGWMLILGHLSVHGMGECQYWVPLSANSTMIC